MKLHIYHLCAVFYCCCLSGLRFAEPIWHSTLRGTSVRTRLPIEHAPASLSAASTSSSLSFRPAAGEATSAVDAAEPEPPRPDLLGGHTRYTCVVTTPWPYRRVRGGVTVLAYLPVSRPRNYYMKRYCSFHSQKGEENKGRVRHRSIKMEMKRSAVSLLRGSFQLVKEPNDYLNA